MVEESGKEGDSEGTAREKRRVIRRRGVESRRKKVRARDSIKCDTGSGHFIEKGKSEISHTSLNILFSSTRKKLSIKFHDNYLEVVI